MNSTRARVKLAERSYDVVVGEGILERIDEIVGETESNLASIITDSNVGPLYADRIEKPLARVGLGVFLVQVEPGEESKSIGKARELLELLAESRMTRNDLVISLGGGVVGDLAGFVASVFKRGCKLLHIPTSLMSQVDSSIGGKTGVNLPHGKNLVGTFYQPLAVVCDVETLETLPDREYVSGLAEVAKYGLIRPDAWPMPLLSLAGDLGQREQSTLVEVIGRCAGIKAEVVSADELDAGPRSILNYGHTLGHALEAASGYSDEYTHGEAISIGMFFAAHVSVELGLADESLIEGHRALLGSMGLPLAPASGGPGFDEVMRALLQDKKSRGDLAMVLLEKEGAWRLCRDLDEGVLRDCYLRLTGD